MVAHTNDDILPHGMGLLSLVINFRYKKKEQATKDEADFWHIGNNENAADLVKELGDDGDQEAG